MSEYKRAILLSSAVIGSIATVTARLGKSPLNASDVIKPVGIGMGIIAASYALGATYKAFSNTRVNKYGQTSLEDQDQLFWKRFKTAQSAYNVASYATPLVVAGVGGYMIYDRYTRS
jgi:hypothetical protein